MKPRIKLFYNYTVSILTLAGLLFFGSGQIAVAQDEPSSAAIGQRSDNFGIEGTWRVTVTQIVCDTSAPIGSPFASLLTFVRGGTMTGTTANPAFLAGQRSGDHGVWSSTSRNNYSAIDAAFVLFSGGPFTQGSQVIRHSIRLTNFKSSFTDIATLQFYDVNGAPLLPAPGCATAVGQRLQ